MKRESLLDLEHTYSLLSEYSEISFLKINRLIDKDLIRITKLAQSDLAINSIIKLELLNEIVKEELLKFSNISKEEVSKKSDLLKVKIYFKKQELDRKINEIIFKNSFGLNLSGFDAISVQSSDLEIRKLNKIWKFSYNIH